MLSHAGLLTFNGEEQLRALGARLRQARTRRGLTQRILAERAGISLPTLGRLEAGEGSVSLNALMNVLTGLDMESDLSHVADPAQDKVGMIHEWRNQPKRVRERKHELDTDF